MKSNNINLEPTAYFNYLIETTTIPQIPANRGKAYHAIISNVTTEGKTVGIEKDMEKATFILKTCCRMFKVNTWIMVTMKTRKREYIMPRFLSVFFIKKYTRLTLNEIAAFLWRGAGKPYDHATIIHANTVCQNDIDSKTNQDGFYDRYLIVKKIFEAEYENQDDINQVSQETF